MGIEVVMGIMHKLHLLQGKVKSRNVKSKRVMCAVRIVGDGHEESSFDVAASHNQNPVASLPTTSQNVSKKSWSPFLSTFLFRSE